MVCCSTHLTVDLGAVEMWNLHLEKLAVLAVGSWAELGIIMKAKTLTKIL